MANRPDVIRRNVESVSLVRSRKVDSASTVADAVAGITDAAAALNRALATTTAPDVQALVSGARVNVALPVVSWPTVDALRTQTLAGDTSNVLPIPQPRPAAVEQTSEKTEVGSHTFTLQLAAFDPRSFALATNMSSQAEAAQPYVEAQVAAAVAAQVDLALLADLGTAAGAGAADAGAAVAAVVAAGWSDLVLIVPLAEVVAQPTAYGALGALNVAVIVDAHAADVLVVARDGVAVMVSGPELLRGPSEPALVGTEVGAWAAYQSAIGTGAVAKVGP
jgi:hypothetical protein